MSRQEEDQQQQRVKIRQLPTGVPGLDEILGGGLPEYSFNIIAGGPGCGKTTLVHQFVFANAAHEFIPMAVGVLNPGHAELAQIVQAHGAFGLLAGTAQGGYQHRDQQRDDGDNDQNFQKRESGERLRRPGECMSIGCFTCQKRRHHRDCTRIP